MKKKRIIALLAIVALVGLAVAIHRTVLAGNNNGPHYRLDGTWVMYSPAYDCLTTATFVPASPANNRVAFSADFVDSDVITPAASLEQNMAARGEAVRTGPRTFEHTWIYYGRNPDREVEYILVGQGTVELIDRNTYEETVGITLYWPSQDVDPHDGLPDFNEVGIPLPTSEHTAKRLVPVSH